MKDKDKQKSIALFYKILWSLLSYNSSVKITLQVIFLAFTVNKKKTFRASIIILRY